MWNKQIIIGFKSQAYVLCEFGSCKFLKTMDCEEIDILAKNAKETLFSVDVSGNVTGILLPLSVS